MHKTLVLSVFFSLCLSLNFSQAQSTRDAIMDQLQLGSNGKTNGVKTFPDSFPEVLTARGTPTVYTRKNSSDFEYIGMPVGGIGAGHLYLGGDGQLWFWDMFGLNYRLGQLKGEEAYQYPYKRSEPNQFGALMPNQGFSISAKVGDNWVTKTLNRDGIKDIEFLGQYPIGNVKYNDPELPVEVSLEAYSPFIPLDVDSSSLPATVLRFKIRNTSSDPVEARLDGWLDNLILVGSRKNSELALKGQRTNQALKLPEGMRIEFAAEVTGGKGVAADLSDFGTMSLSLLGDQVTAEAEKQSCELTGDVDALVGKLSESLKLGPGEEKTATFILSWNFPTTYAVFAEKWWGKNKSEIKTKRTRYYANRFKNSSEVSDFVIANLDELSAKTRLWRDTWYDSTLPHWFLDRTFLNTSILASTTCHLIDDRLFYGSEGGNQGPGTITHVWGYVQAMGRLFPDLEKSLREQVDFVPVKDGGALMDDGTVRFRWFIEGQDLAVDGQAGVIMRTYLAHQMSKDDAFLKRVYPGLKKVMQGLTELRDADHDGILTGAQHNTLDADWFGKVPWLSLYYTCALRATAEMADEIGDEEYANEIRSMADMGRKYIEDNLFNGEYFFHEADPEHLDSPGTYTGLEYSQLLGQSWAYQAGLGEILDPVKTKTALESMWRYNFSTDVGPFRKVYESGRWYAMPGEGGMIACTWPRGGSEVLKNGDPRYAAYNNECQNGYEYAATSLMMWHGMPYHALAHIWYMHNNRYHGSKRNPWCEVEWGVHYARSMASYGHFTAACGYEYHGPKGELAFAPKITPESFKAPFTAAEGWGTLSQERSENSQTCKIKLKHGKLNLNTLTLEVAKGWKPSSVKVLVDQNQNVTFSTEQQANRVTIQFTDELKLGVGQTLQVNFLK